METKVVWLERANSQYIIASVDRAVELLLLLGRHRRDMGVTELAKELGVQKSTIHSLLQTLMLRGFVRQTDSGRYTLGYGLIRLGEACAEQLDIREIARPLMAELANESQEIALLAVLSGTELIIIEKVEPQRPFFIIPKFDFSITLHSTAIGKVLLANAPPAIVGEVLQRGVERFTPYTLTDREVLQKELAQVREQGFAVGCNETIEGGNLHRRACLRCCWQGCGRPVGVERQQGTRRPALRDPCAAAQGEGREDRPALRLSACLRIEGNIL